MEADGAGTQVRLLTLSMYRRANLDLMCERALYATRQQLIPFRQDSHEHKASRMSLTSAADGLVRQE
jgi:hypothetical protein